MFQQINSQCVGPTCTGYSGAGCPYAGCDGGVGGLLLGIVVLLGLSGTERDARFDVGVCVGVAGRCGGVVAGADEPEDGGG